MTHSHCVWMKIPQRSWVQIPFGPFTLNTLGYKASKRGVPSFVIAAHSAVGLGKIIVQPFNIATNRVGTVTPHTNCDCAFVVTNSAL